MVKIKIKTNKKRVYEAAPSLSHHTVKLDVKMKSPEERQRELNDLWGRLIKQKNIDIRKLYSETMNNSGYSIPLAKMNVPVKVKVTDAITGNTHEEEIIPAEIAAFCDMAKATAMTDKQLGVILQRFPKPVIWSFNVDTAASDGVRIAFNPIFAQQLIYQGKQILSDEIASGKRLNGTDRITHMAGLFLFVLVHEAYHQIYRHREQAERKPETQGGKNHTLANIAMDAEINRDIEKQIPVWFAGATVKTGGIFDTRFRMEPWQDIFDAYFYKKLEQPKQINSNPINQNNSSQPQGDSEDNSSSSSSSNQNQSQSGQGKQSNQQNGSGMRQDSGAYDDTDLSKADPDAMADYDDDLEIPDISGKSKEYQDAYEDELRKELDKALGKKPQNSDKSDENNDSGKDGDNGDESDDNSQMSNSNSNSAEERAAREQARKDIQKAIEDLKDKIETEMSEISDDETQQKQLEGKVFETETASTFGGADMLSQEEMAELAAEAGSPYTSQELTVNVDELNKQFNEKHDAELKAISPDLQKKLTDIEDKLKAMLPLANWKMKLKKHFRDAMEGSVKHVRSKRAMSQKWRDDRYNPYKEREYKEQNGANVFYLIDGSGSMYVNGNGVFLQIFKDIITIEKSCNVDMSCRAYFADYAITPKDCAIWDHKTSKNKVLDILTTMGPEGGTDVPDNVMAVTKLKPPYYFNKDNKHTLIMVFTDGLTNTGSGWSTLARIPYKIRKDVVFVILNTKQEIMRIIPQIMAQGVPLKNILGINILAYNNN